MNALEVVQKIITGISNYLTITYSAEAANQFQQQVQETNWWPSFTNWLSNEPLVDRDTTVLNFAKTFIQDNPTVSFGLQQALKIDKEFWDLVFQNIRLAKSLL